MCMELSRRVIAHVIAGVCAPDKYGTRTAVVLIRGIWNCAARAYSSLVMAALRA